MTKLVKALKEFDYAHDGIHLRTIVENEVFHCQDDLFESLVRDKCVEEAPDEEDAVLVPVTIPENWEALNEADKIALASEIFGKKVKKIEAATAIITAEVENRAAKASE